MFPKLTLTPKEARELGLTHHGSYYGIPIYIGNLEFYEQESIEIAIKYRLAVPFFHLVTFIEWLFTAPNKGVQIMLLKEIEEE